VQQETFPVEPVAWLPVLWYAGGVKAIKWQVFLGMGTSLLKPLMTGSVIEIWNY
jgi:hypothetical protein